MQPKETPDNLWEITKGLYRLSEEEYFGDEINAHSQSTIKKIKNFSIKRILKEKSEDKDTKDRRIGKGAHALVLEGRKSYESRFYASPEIIAPPSKVMYLAKNLGSVEDWKEARRNYTILKDEDTANIIKAEEAGKILLSFKEGQSIEGVKTGCDESALFQEVFKDSLIESTVIAWHFLSMLNIKTRPDILNIEKGILVDFKTADDIDHDNFYYKSYRKYSYNYQLACYRWACEKVGIKINKVYLAVASKQCPEVAVYEISLNDLDEAFIEFEEIIMQYAHELKESKAGRTRYDEILRLEPPVYKDKEADFKAIKKAINKDKDYTIIHDEGIVALVNTMWKLRENRGKYAIYSAGYHKLKAAVINELTADRTICGEVKIIKHFRRGKEVVLFKYPREKK